MLNGLVLPLVPFCAWAVSAQDAVKVNPEHNKAEIDNDPVRVVRTTLPAGYEVPLHQHLLGVTITKKDRTWESIYPGEPALPAQLVKAGSLGGFSDGGPAHRTKNAGASGGEAVRVELKTKL